MGESSQYARMARDYRNASGSAPSLRKPKVSLQSSNSTISLTVGRPHEENEKAQVSRVIDDI